MNAPSISTNKVLPSGPPSSKILILGEHPDRDEDFLKIPFVGANGDFFRSLLSHTNIDLSTCYTTNVLNYFPHDHDFKSAKGTWQLEEGLKELSVHLLTHQPKLIICLGNEALKAIMGFDGISNWRGSVLKMGNSLVLPTYSPSKVILAGDLATQVVFDLKKAERILHEGYQTPVHNFIENPPSLDPYLPLISSSPHIAVDIETIKETTHILSISFAWSATEALAFQNRYPLGNGVDEEFKKQCERIFSALKEMEFQNGTFDVEVLEVNHIKVPREKYTFDTMVAQRILEPELPIGLDFLASIYTDEPYYKAEGKQIGKVIPLTLLSYNNTDTIVTWQSREAQEKLFKENPLQHKSFLSEMEDLEVVLDFQRNGMLVDEERRKYLEDYIFSLLKADAALLFTLVGRVFNHNSPPQVCNLLYKELLLPVKRNKKKNLSSDEDAIVSLIQYCKKELDSSSKKKEMEWMKKLGILKLILKVRGHEKMLSSYLKFKISSDGRVRSSWKMVGTETGRWSCGLYVDGTGFNAQTPPREVFDIPFSEN